MQRASDMKSLSALVVDDNSHMRTILVTLLRALRISDIVEATDGADALDALRNKTFDLVLADINMQPIDGIEFTQLVRRSMDSLSPTVPIIMVTGHTERRRVEAARDAGVTEFVAKPVTASALYSRINVALERPRQFVRTKSFVGPDRRRTANRRFSGPFRRADDELEVNDAETDPGLGDD